MRILLFLFTLIIMALATLQFSSFTQLNDPELIKHVQSYLLDEYREKSADQFNQSLENDSFGKILNRAADIFTTRVTMLNTSKSRGLKLKPGPLKGVVHVRFLVENSSEEPLETERYMNFLRLEDKSWAYTGPTSRRDYYLNFLSID